MAEESKVVFMDSFKVEYRDKSELFSFFLFLDEENSHAKFQNGFDFQSSIKSFRLSIENFGEWI